MRIAALAFVVISGLASSGCGGESEPPTFEDGPGATPWEGDVKCTADADCLVGESCLDGVCQIQRCDGTFKPTPPPFGGHLDLGGDREILALAGGAELRGYETASGELTASWDVGGSDAVDVAGGNLLGSRPLALAIARKDSTKITVRGPDGDRELDAGIVPKSLAAGDVDGDGIDEIVAVAADGGIALCDAIAGQCAPGRLEGASGVDVAIADIDSDGFEEPMFLVEIGGKSKLVVWNVDGDKTGEDELKTWTFQMNVKAIAAGNVNGLGVAEAVLLEERGGTTKDRLHVFRPNVGELSGYIDVSSASLDVAVGDIDLDGEAEMHVLREGNAVATYHYEGGGVLKLVKDTKIAGSSAVTRIKSFDVDDDTPVARLVEGPNLFAGAAVPAAVLVAPPFVRNRSDGNGDVTVGETESKSESTTDTVAVHVGVSVGVGGGLGIFTASLKGYFAKDYVTSKTLTKTISVGKRFTFDAKPEKYGNDYAGVVVTGACYHEFVYETEDPAGVVGGSGQEVHVFVPVGMQTALWTSTRYNALAVALGNLPTIDVPSKIGDPASYPAEPTGIDGQPIAAEDMLFPSPPSFEVSDNGKVGWSMTVGKQKTNAASETTTVGVAASVGVAFLEFGAEYNKGNGTGYSITVGKEAVFAGSAPALPDDPNTPEDEFALYRYSFEPIVYRQKYATADADKTGGYYVVTYTVKP